MRIGLSTGGGKAAHQAAQKPREEQIEGAMRLITTERARAR